MGNTALTVGDWGKEKVKYSETARKSEGTGQRAGGLVGKAPVEGSGARAWHSAVPSQGDARHGNGRSSPRARQPSQHRRGRH